MWRCSLAVACGRRLRFAPLQSEAGKALLLRSGRSSHDISSLVLVEIDRFVSLPLYYEVFSISRFPINPCSGTLFKELQGYSCSEDTFWFWFKLGWSICNRSCSIQKLLAPHRLSMYLLYPLCSTCKQSRLLAGCARTSVGLFPFFSFDDPLIWLSLNALYIQEGLCCEGAYVCCTNLGCESLIRIGRDFDSLDHKHSPLSVDT